MSTRRQGSARAGSVHPDPTSGRQPARRSARRSTPHDGPARNAPPADALFENAPCIASVEADPQDPNLRRVRVGRRVVAVVAAHDAESLDVRPGAAWDAPLAAAVARRAATIAVRRDALRALARSSLASTRLKERLARRGHDAAVIEEVVDGLIRDGWLDDRQVAEAAVESIQRRGRLPRGAVAAKLVARGVDADLAARVARRGAAPGEEEFAACADLAATLLARSSVTGRATSRMREQRARRVAASLARRGFDPDIIARVLEDAGAGAAVAPDADAIGRDDLDALEN